MTIEVDGNTNNAITTSPEQQHGGILYTRRNSRSHRAKLLHSLIKPLRPRLTVPGKPEKGPSQQLQPYSFVHMKCSVAHKQVEDVWVCDLTPKAQSREDAVCTRRIYYFAGGGFQMPPSIAHWKFCTELCLRLSEKESKVEVDGENAAKSSGRETYTTVSVVSYPLAPNCPFSSAWPILRKFYQAITPSTTVETILAGDSSGANIALSLTLDSINDTQNDIEPRAPNSLLLISPVVNMHNTHPSQPQIAKLDPILTIPFTSSVAETWCGGDTSFDDPRVSPVLSSRAQLQKLSDAGVIVNGLIATWDVLAPDTLDFVERLNRETSVNGEWLVWDGQEHVFVLKEFFGFPEAKEARDWILKVLDKQTRERGQGKVDGV